MCMSGRNNFLIYLTVILITMMMSACGKEQSSQKDKQCEQWKVLNKALTALYNEDFYTYLSFVDSAQLVSKDKTMVLNALKQRYSKTDSTRIPKLFFSKLNLINADSADIYYTEIYNNDTVYEMKKMRRFNDNWKLLIF